MKGLSRRARACAVTAAAGLATLAGGAAAQAQDPPEKVGDGIRTGQMSVQMFNYGSYLSSGSAQSTGPNNPVTGVSEACLTSTTPECRRERLERLFAFLQSKGVTSIELFQHQGFPQPTDIPGLEAYRALMDKYGLHAAGWHGSMSEAGWETRVNAAKILGADYIGSGGVADNVDVPGGIRSYDSTIQAAQVLNRLGKRSVEAGVGPVYIHNHTEEFDRKYMENGVLKTAFEIILDNTDPRYVTAELDVFWSSDAHDDQTGNASAALINKYPNRIQMLHIKDGINVLNRGNNYADGTSNSRGGSPRATGTGEVDFRPIFAAAVNRVRYYHQEHDGGTLTDANTSFTNLKGRNSAVVPTLLGLPVKFPSVPAGTPAASNQMPVTIQNTGDKPLNITNLQITADAADVGNAADFALISNNCVGQTLQAGKPATGDLPAIPRGTCTVNVGYKPTKAGVASVARLQFTSDADDATERVLLTGTSTNQAKVGVGGTVPGVLSLTVPGSVSFGAFMPGLAKPYDVSLAASVTSTADNAALTVTDTSDNAPGHLVNGADALDTVLATRSPSAAEPNPAWTNLSETAGAPTTVRTWSGPVTNEPSQIALRQQIGANEALRAGTYSKTLTFTLSTTTP
jgi:sugar phosphate isomerase/epimerase